MAGLQKPVCDSKLSSTCDTLSRENSLSSLPETECEWPELDGHCTPVQSLPGVFVPPLLQSDSGAGAPGRRMPPTPTLFQVAYRGGLEVRAGPFDAPLTGLVLAHNEAFVVTQDIAGMDGRVYLCLADGRGWVFDDSKLMPHDPSVVRCAYTAPHATQNLTLQAMASPSYLSMPPTQSPQVPRAELLLPQAPVMCSPPIAPPPRGELFASTPIGMTPVPIGSPGPAQMQTILRDNAAGPSSVSWFRVAFVGGVQLRTMPSISAALTCTTLLQHETFAVAEEVPLSDGRVYLRLCDGRGWAFDDTALMPHDPSVKRGSWMSVQPNCYHAFFPSGVLEGVEVDALPNRRRRMYPQPRGKRGGKRCSKRKQPADVAGIGAEGYRHKP